MTQEDAPTWTTPHAAVAAAVAALRKRQGWTADELAQECARLGMPALNRSVIANIESGRRKYVSVDEMCCLAYALEVAPVHLLVPTGAAGDPVPTYYASTPEVMMSARDARQWIRGELAPPNTDPRRFFSNVPANEFSAARVMEDDRARTRRDFANRLEGRPAKGDGG